MNQMKSPSRAESRLLVEALTLPIAGTATTLPAAFTKARNSLPPMVELDHEGKPIEERVKYNRGSQLAAQRLVDKANHTSRTARGYDSGGFKPKD